MTPVTAPVQWLTAAEWIARHRETEQPVSEREAS